MKRKLTFILLLASLAFAGCDKLPLQKSYRYEPKPLDPHQGVTCWEYIMNEDNLATMEKAVKHCGMEEYYSQEKEKNTYLLLDETAFTKILEQLGVDIIADADVKALQDILLFHIVKGEWDAYNGTLNYDPVYVIPLWKDPDAVMTIRLNQPSSLSQAEQDKVMFMDQCGRSSVVKATTSNLLMTNGSAHILSSHCVYKK